MMELTAKQAQQVLCAEMNARGITQAALAKRLRISPAYINLVVHGHRRPTGRLLKWLGLEAFVTYTYRFKPNRTAERASSVSEVMNDGK